MNTDMTSPSSPEAPATAGVPAVPASRRGRRRAAPEAQPPTPARLTLLDRDLSILSFNERVLRTPPRAEHLS